MESWCQQSGEDETNQNKVLHGKTLEQKVNGVLAEALHLTERLEADRQNAEKALLQEKEKSRFLKNKFASISTWRQKEHSSDVQKENDTCRKDIKQLKSQLRLERKKLNQTQEKLSRATVLNQHLQEDLSFVQKQILIVTEDLEHQNDLIDQLKTTQAQADDVCSETRHDLLQAQEKLKVARVDADKEKLLMECELLPMRKRTEERLEELKQLKTAEKNLISEIKDTEENVDLIEKTCALLSRRIPQIEECEKCEKDKVSQLKLQIEDKILKNRKLSSVKEDIEETKRKGMAEVSSIEEQLQSKHEAVERLLKENIDYEQKIEDCKMKICQSEKTLKQINKETRDVLLDISDTEEQQKTAAKQLMQIAAQHRNSQNELKEKKQLSLSQERRAKVELQNVNTEMKEKQISSDQINQDLQKEFEDAALKVKDLEANVKEIRQMTEKLEEIQSDHKKMLVELKQEKQLKCDQLNAALDLFESTTKRCDIILGRITDLMNECEDYHNAADQMDKNVEHMQEEIAGLQMDLNVVEFKHKSAAHIMRILRSDVKACKERTQRSVQTHTTLVIARTKQMQDTKEALQAALVENQLFSDKYKRLQKTLMEARREAVSALSEQNRSHQAFHYYTQLSMMQKRMHKAFEKYLKQRSLHSQAELDRCQALSEETYQKMKAAEEKLSEEIRLISEFLESVTDDSATTDDAG
ncbi:Coiled-coil domain-containing protein 178 [Oryzias melastigma]|uniref:Coiled-coil domain-containing protein 178 n=1 Tax=Oryzias melastigma TaxID=30732 RepID=A0A834CIY5_ORYME|nr:Coiled-coil domain-containing protein 178 [Oryzias melastigma]